MNKFDIFNYYFFSDVKKFSVASSTYYDCSGTTSPSSPTQLNKVKFDYYNQVPNMNLTGSGEGWIDGR